MPLVILTALGVGLSTCVGIGLTIWVKNLSHRVSDAILSFAAGVMLCATFNSLIIPAIEESSGFWSYILCALGIITGAYVISLVDLFVPHLHRIIKFHPENDAMRRVMLFVIAIAIHNFPEGLAVGVSFAGDNIQNAMSVAIGISLQNIPEGMVTFLPLILAGFGRKKAVVIALITGVVQIAGVLLGHSFVHLTTMMLPFFLCFAAGIMLYVISNDMIPETHSHGYEKTATFSLVAGVIGMLLIDYGMGMIF